MIQTLIATRGKAFMWLAGVLLATAAAGCSPVVDHRGYVAKPGAFDQITNGMSKTEVESILGSPSTTASVNYNGDSFYYITSITEGRAFMAPKETNREVIAIRFDQSDQVRSFAQYGLQDGRVIDINTGETLVIGENNSLIAQLLKGAGATTAGPVLGRKL